MKVVDNIKSVGQVIKAIYTRLGEVDCPDEEVLDISQSGNKELVDSLARVNALESKYNVSNVGKSSGKNIVQRVNTDSLAAVKKAEQKVVEEKSAEKER